MRPREGTYTTVMPDWIIEGADGFHLAYEHAIRSEGIISISIVATCGHGAAFIMSPRGRREEGQEGDLGRRERGERDQQKSSLSVPCYIHGWFEVVY